MSALGRRCVPDGVEEVGGVVGHGQAAGLLSNQLVPRPVELPARALRQDHVALGAVEGVAVFVPSWT